MSQDSEAANLTLLRVKKKESIFICYIPYFQKNTAFRKVPRIRPFVILMREMYR